jgi:hypothetical protein
LATPLCVYVKFNGVPCGSPALRGKVFCYHHARSRTARQSNIIIPPPDSPDAMMYTNHALLQLMFNKKITIGEYRAAVQGFRITATLMKMSEKYADAARVTDVSRHIATDIAFAGPDADVEETHVTGHDFSRADTPNEDAALAAGANVGARLASPAAIPATQVKGCDFSHAEAPNENAALAADANVAARLASPVISATQVKGREFTRADSSMATGALAPAVNDAAPLEPPIELQPHSRSPVALGASVSHSALADPIELDPILVENAKLEPRPTPPPEFKFPPRPLTQEELDDPYVRPTSDALADYLNREYLKRRRMFG